MSIASIVDAMSKDEVKRVVMYEKSKGREAFVLNVRGLGIFECVHLTHHFPDVMNFIFNHECNFDSYNLKGKELSLLKKKILEEIPIFLFSAISLACDEPESAHLISKFPADKQMKLLVAVMETTLPSGREAIKKIVSATIQIFLQGNKSTNTKKKKDELKRKEILAQRVSQRSS
ncbi:TPA: hypothetical protein NGS33_003413 [Vibrio parahaemolyticus]|uniref:phage pre-tape measure protein n=1 Tax=Vibrio parahaemolyticus TaxID=670 RepID=UPI0011230DE1|nr:hypothetical protein [Vibrio parahaemolyticus]TPA81846.1 hypothetical protein DXJ87_21760 [Vibrio parahaemolyticus]HCE1745712.1 hypothetical protein [Vibrio parahaemolyticus]